MKRPVGAILAVGGLLVLLLAFLTLLLPVLGLSGYWLRLLSTVYMAVALAQGMNLMVGYAGYPAFGNLVFFGLGGYATAVAMSHYGWPFPLAVVLAAVLAAVYATLVGLPVLRLRGAYFAIATIGVNEATREIVLNIPALTGGGRGINLPFYPGDVVAQQMFFYYLMWMLGAGATLIVWLVSRSRLGYALRALKADEQAARVTGINTTVVKTATWAMSAAMTGVVGAAYAYWLSFLEPAPVFDIVLSVRYYITAILGGAGTVLGPVAGAFFFEILSEMVWSQFLTFHMLVLGAVVVAVVLFMPRGIAGLFAPYLRAARRGEAP